MNLNGFDILAELGSIKVDFNKYDDRTYEFKPEHNFFIRRKTQTFKDKMYAGLDVGETEVNHFLFLRESEPFLSTSKSIRFNGEVYDIHDITDNGRDVILVTTIRNGAF